RPPLARTARSTWDRRARRAAPTTDGPAWCRTRAHSALPARRSPRPRCSRETRRRVRRPVSCAQDLVLRTLFSGRPDRHEIAEREAIVPDDGVARLEANARCKSGPIVYERVELAALAARIDARRKLVEEGGVV